MPHAYLWYILAPAMYADQQATDAEGRTPQQVLVLGRGAHHHVSSDRSEESKEHEAFSAAADEASTPKEGGKGSVTEVVYVDEQVRGNVR